jgi:hypothetical protein
MAKWSNSENINVRFKSIIKFVIVDETLNNVMKMHKHHIIPKHAGGTNEAENLVLLTIAEHADAHRILFETYGRWQDRVTWLSLAGIMKDEERIYEILKNSNPGGYKHTQETKDKLSDMRLGEKNPMYGVPAANRGKLRPGIGGRRIGTKWSADERATQTATRDTQEHREKMKSVYADPIRNAKISKAQHGKQGTVTGKTWYNNGTIEKFDTECPSGFTVGRISRLQPNKKGLRWFNDGTINRQFKDGQQQIGFVHGRISKK